MVPTAERLAEEVHIRVPDLPGFGRSGNSLVPLDVSDLADAAADFLEDPGIERASGSSSSPPPEGCTTSGSSGRWASWSATGRRPPSDAGPR